MSLGHRMRAVLMVPLLALLPLSGCGDTGQSRPENPGRPGTTEAGTTDTAEVGTGDASAPEDR